MGRRLCGLDGVGDVLSVSQKGCWTFYSKVSLLVSTTEQEVTPHEYVVPPLPPVPKP